VTLQHCGIAARTAATLHYNSRCCDVGARNVATLQERCFAIGGVMLLYNDGGRRYLNFFFGFFFTQQLHEEGTFLCVKERERKRKRGGALKLVKNLNSVGWHNTSSFL
jgi:hypothetical protein